MRPVRYSACAWLVAAALGGCAGGEAESGAEVRVTSPELMTVSPGVQVVADADEPLFYADGYYWLYRDGIWLRSDSYRGGFARIDVNMVPGEIRDISQPQMYAHYRRHAGQQNYARGSQIRERQPARPQGTYQQPPQQQQPMQQPQQPYQQPAQPGRTPTEPQPSSPSQQPPVPNPMPQSQGTPGTNTPSTPGAQGSQIPENSPGAPLPSQRDRGTDRDRQNGGATTSPSTTPSDTDKDRTKSSTDVDTNRSDLDKNKSGMDKSGMNREQNDADKDNNKKARGNDQNKKDKSDKDVDKKTSPY